MDDSQKIREESVTIHGHPGLELGDVITTGHESGADGSVRRVLGFNETIGTVYEMSLSDLGAPEVETP